MGDGSFSPEVFARVFTAAFVEAFREACTTTVTPPSQVRVNRISDEEWMAREAAVLTTTEFPDLYRDLADCMVAQNQTGRASLSRIVGTLLEPLLKVEQDTTAERFEHGVRQALSHTAPNANYVKKAAAGYTPPRLSGTHEVRGVSASGILAMAEDMRRERLSQTKEIGDGC
jgi:hypothetical protein